MATMEYISTQLDLLHLTMSILESTTIMHYIQRKISHVTIAQLTYFSSPGWTTYVYVYNSYFANSYSSYAIDAYRANLVIENSTFANCSTIYS
jgi:hypothetical protein